MEAVCQESQDAGPGHLSGLGSNTTLDVLEGSQPLSMKLTANLPFLTSSFSPEVSGEANLAGRRTLLESMVTLTALAGTRSTRNLPSLTLPPTNWPSSRWKVIFASVSG